MQSETPELIAQFARCPRPPCPCPPPRHQPCRVGALKTLPTVPHGRYPDFVEGVTIEYYGAVTAATKHRFETNWAQQPIAWHSPVLGFTCSLPARTVDARLD